MLFVAILRSREGISDEITARRIQWDYPEGCKLIGEYWLQSDDPAVVSIFEAESIAPVMLITRAWRDAFDITVIPAITAEEGMEMVKQMAQG